MSGRFLEILLKGANELGISLNESMENNFLIYYQQLKRWSKAYNLTALKTEEDIAVRLFLDSMAFSCLLSPLPRTALDVGSGAGFPGLVLSILHPELEIVLVEPSKKKAAFLLSLKKRLSLDNLEVYDKTIEEYTSEHKRCFQLITTRALFSAKRLLRKTRQLHCSGTLLLLSKGPSYRKELSQLKGYPDYTISHREVQIPFTGMVRHFILIKRR